MNKTYYDKMSKKDYEEYKKIQIKMWEIKKEKRRNMLEYAYVALQIKEEILNHSDKLEMICLGARNNHERDEFEHILSLRGCKNVNVYSLDISPDAEVDYHYDFGSLPKEWSNRFDIIYTNAADHSFDFEKCLLEWQRIMKPTGVFVLGIADQDMIYDNEKQTTPKPCAHGCTIFDPSAVSTISKEHFNETLFLPRSTQKFEVNNELTEYFTNYHYWFNYGKIKE